MKNYFYLFLLIIVLLIVSGCNDSNDVDNEKADAEKVDNVEEVFGWKYSFDENGERLEVDLDINSSQEFRSQVDSKYSRLMELRKLSESGVLKYFNNIDFKYDKPSNYEYIYVEEMKKIEENSTFLEELILMENIMKSNISTIGNRYAPSRYIGKETFDIVVKRFDGSYYSVNGSYLEHAYSDYLFDYIKTDLDKERIDSLIKYSVSYYGYLDNK